MKTVPEVFRIHAIGREITATTYYNHGTRPDTHPSPGGTSLFTATDVQTHAYKMAGTFNLTPTVRDDERGVIESSATMTLT